MPTRECPAECALLAKLMALLASPETAPTYSKYIYIYTYTYTSDIKYITARQYLAGTILQSIGSHGRVGTEASLQNTHQLWISVGSEIDALHSQSTGKTTTQLSLRKVHGVCDGDDGEGSLSGPLQQSIQYGGLLGLLSIPICIIRGGGPQQGIHFIQNQHAMPALTVLKVPIQSLDGCRRGGLLPRQPIIQQRVDVMWMSHLHAIHFHPIKRPSRHSLQY